MARIAHTPNDVKKRRAAFEERWKSFQGRMLNEEQIRKEVFVPIKITSLNTYFCKERNPLFGFENGVFSYTEKPFRQALIKAKADISQFKMSESRGKESRSSGLYSSILCHSCFLTYQNVQMMIERRSIEGSPFGSYTVTPALQLPVENAWVVPETQFFWLNLPRLLMDVALEYSIRQEEYNYHCRQLKVFKMESTVFDESSITLPDNPELWMPIIENYFLMMKKRYNDTFPLATLYPNSRESMYYWPAWQRRNNRTPIEMFNDFCKEMGVNVQFRIGEGTHLTEPSGERREGFFMVDGYVLYIEEFRYYTSSKNKCIIYPYHQHPEFSFTLNGSLGLRALVGYLKQMPKLCRKID